MVPVVVLESMTLFNRPVGHLVGLCYPDEMDERKGTRYQGLSHNIFLKEASVRKYRTVG